MAWRRKSDERGHLDSWLVSYCDMISLLVTFFLMMMTFSTRDRFDVREVGAGILRGGGGIWRNPVSMPEESAVDSGAVARIGRALAALAVDEGQRVSVRPVSDGFAISFDLESSFAPSSDVPTAILRANLERLSVALAPHRRLLVVEGFTDTAFVATAEFPTEDDLALARANSAADILIESKAFSADQVQLASLGSLRPRAPNDTESGRASNRRVEVRVVPLVSTRDILARAEER